MVRRVLVTLAVVVVVSSCRNKQPPARSVTPPTQEEAAAFGEQFAKHLGPCNESALEPMIDTELLLSRAVANRSLRAQEVKGIGRGLGPLGRRLCQELGEATVIATFLRTQMVDGTPRPLVRLVIDHGINYYQLELDKRGGTIRVADLYVFLAGENMSETLGGLLDTLKESASAMALATTNEMKKQMRAGHWKEAHALFEALPAELRNSKPIRLLEVQIAAELGDDVYVTAMNKYVKAYPNDPSLALVQIDRLLLQKQYDATLAALDQLDRLVGGDPYLEIMRVDALGNLGKHAEAIAAAKRGAAAEPSLESVWWALLTAQVAGGEYADALPTLEALRDKFGIEITADALAADERFTKLVASEAFQAWSAR